MTEEHIIYANGIGIDGNYLLTPMPESQLAKAARGEKISDDEKFDIKIRKDVNDPNKPTVFEPFDKKFLHDAGWGVIFPDGIDPHIEDALKPLLELRKAQATENGSERMYQRLTYKRGMTKNTFLSSYKTGPGVADPKRGIPYYLLIVGSPTDIPYSFQYQIDVHYAVGRIWFDTAEEYASYAQSVVYAETGKISLPRKATFFAVETDGDRATEASARNLIHPLYNTLMANEEAATWDMRLIRGYGNPSQNIQPANHSNLERLMGGKDTPALLFTASHGMGFPFGDKRMLAHQGALLCQDWRGIGKPITEDVYFAGDHIASDANLGGMIAFFFACYGAGTPQHDEFYRQAFTDKPSQIAPHPFIARLPYRMLTHPKGGALAVVGHVERAWGYSFMWEGTQNAQIETFRSAMLLLLRGMPVGMAIEYFNGRYAEIASDYTSYLSELQVTGAAPDDFKVASQWTQLNDSRNYAIVGDPAVRLPIRDDSSGDAVRPLLNIDTSALTPITTTLNPPADSGVSGSTASRSSSYSPAKSFSVFANGINAKGTYLLPANITTADLINLARGKKLSADDQIEIKKRQQLDKQKKLKERSGIIDRGPSVPGAGLDPKQLNQVGWGVIYPENIDAAIKEALQPLLTLRKNQATANNADERNYRELTYRQGTSKSEFLSSYGVGPGPTNPKTGLPYYLLIVGSPQDIPYHVQYQLDVQYGVGRIWFDTVEEFANYAQSVVNAETGKITLPRNVTFFAVDTPGDAATEASAQHLIQPLYERLSSEIPGWQMRLFRGQGEATHSNLERLLSGKENTALLFTASHGMGFDLGDPKQLVHQGALLCQEWAGPGSGAIPESVYFAGDHIASDANLAGLIAFFFACYGAGCPQHDEFFQQAFDDRPSQVAPHPFVAGLPRRMLALPKGGALAVVGHVERAWGYSFLSDGTSSPQIATFSSAITELLKNNYPIGAAIDHFNSKYAELTSDLTTMLDSSEPTDEFEMAMMWTQINDSRNYAVIGDPAVRMTVGDSNASAGDPTRATTVPTITTQSQETITSPASAAGGVTLAPTQTATPPVQSEPEPIAPEPIAPEPIAPEPIVPEPIVPEPIAPEPIAPEQTPPPRATKLIANGIDIDGVYAVRPIEMSELVKAIRSYRLDIADKTDVKKYTSVDIQRTPANYTNLSQMGWGVIFSETLDPAIKEALKPLLEFRKQQATAHGGDERNYCELTCTPGMPKTDFLDTYNVELGFTTPTKGLPYYLLIVGSPKDISYDFQRQLDIHYAMGRIWFDTVEEFANYAQSVIAAETGVIKLPRRATFFAAETEGDSVTKASIRHLVLPLYEQLRQDIPDWRIELLRGAGEATCSNLIQLLNGTGKNAPALLFAATHGVVFPPNEHHNRMVPHQGALLCQDWHGMNTPLAENLYVAGDNIAADANLGGMIAFFLASYGAGSSFRVAGLPRRMLSLPNGGALAVVGYVDRAWGYSLFAEGTTSLHTATFTNTITALLQHNYPIGAAMDYFNATYAELANDLFIKKGAQSDDDYNVATKWAQMNDARNYVIIGDPAVRLPLSDSNEGEPIRPVVTNTITAPPQATPKTALLTDDQSNVKLKNEDNHDQNEATQEGELPMENKHEASETSETNEASETSETNKTDASMSFGIGEDVANIGNSLKVATQRLAQRLAVALEDAVTLDIETYVSEQVTPDFDKRGGSTLHAVTKIELDGDIRTCVPMQGGIIDRDLWEIHQSMVEQGQKHRNDMLRLLLALATGRDMNS